MVSLADAFSNELRVTQNSFSSTASSSKVQRTLGRSMRTVRSNLYQNDRIYSFTTAYDDRSSNFSENLTESVIDFRLCELVCENKSQKSVSFDSNLLELSQAFSDYSDCSSDISGELQKLATLSTAKDPKTSESSDSNLESGFQNGEINDRTQDSIELTVIRCVKELKSSSIETQRSAAEEIRLLAKNREENREIIGESGAIPALIHLLRCTDPLTQENAVTALLNLSLFEKNKELVTKAGAIKPLVYALKTGTAVSKQNAACALLSLAFIEDNKASIGACGAIPPLVSLLLNGTNRGKKDAITTLYKLCSLKQNKERAVNAGVVKPLVVLVSERRNGMAEKAMVLLSSLACIPEGKTAIVEEGGIACLVEAIEDVSCRGKEFAVLALLQLCSDSVWNRDLLVREGGIPPLVALSQTGTSRIKQKAETLLQYLREQRQKITPSSP